MGKKSGGAPSSDPMVQMMMADKQAEASKDALSNQNYANRPTINTPWGQQSWQTGSAIDPATGKPVTTWEMNTTLTPESQKALESQQRITQGRSDLAEGMLDKAGASATKSLDFGALPAAPGSMDEAQQQAYARIQKMREPYRADQDASLEQKLANQGVSRGSAQYERAMRTMGDQRSREDTMDMGTAFSEGRQQGAFQNTLRQQALGEQQLAGNYDLNQLNALLSGQQVAMPNMPSFNASGKSETPQYVNAYNQGLSNQWDAYNAQQGQQNSFWSGIGDLAGLAIKAAPLMAASDVRLKSNIVRVGTHPVGVGVYEYDIFGRRERGVIAQELMAVRPDLVHRHASGYLMVNYGGL